MPCAGYTKATPELFRAVQEAGPVTELQVSVWLKNRLARYKRDPIKVRAPRDGVPDADGDYLSCAAK